MKATCLLKLRRGDPPAVLQRRVELLPAAASIYAAYFEIDRTEFGELRFESMTAVLDEFGWTSREERFEVRALWRWMRAEERAIREEQRKAKKAKGSDAPGGDDEE